MASGGQAVSARPFNPSFQHSDRERWICIYPAYINSKKSLAEGRKIPKIKAVDNPLPAEIKEVLLQTGLLLGIENKVYPREVDRNVRGRIRCATEERRRNTCRSTVPESTSVTGVLGRDDSKVENAQPKRLFTAAGECFEWNRWSKKSKGKKK